MIHTPAMQLSFPSPRVALLTLNDPQRGANILSQAVLAEFAATLDQLEQQGTWDGLIICSGKPGIFVAGADLKEFVASFDQPASVIEGICRQGQQLFQRLTRFSGVTVAAIDGICVGGGAELAAWCDFRLGSNSPQTQFAFPEVKLGLYPGWGGTVRATRIVGLANAVEMVTGGEPLTPLAAARMGWFWNVVPSTQLVAAAEALVGEQAASGEYRQLRRVRQQGIRVSENELAFLAATASAYIQGQTKGQYPAPLAALELLLDAAADDEDTALRKEARGMASVFGSPVNRALINVFFLSDRNKKDAGVSGEVTPLPVEKLGVVGAGIMGQGIAAAGLKKELPVVMTDAQGAALRKGAQSVLEEVAYDRELRGPDVNKMSRLSPLLRTAETLQELATTSVVVEAIIEDLNAKQALYTQVEPLLGESSLLASNTSTIPIAKLAANLKHPERFCGLHFFNPVRKMQLCEVIRGPQTSDQTIATAVACAKRMGKAPIVVNDGPGFLVNRLLFPYMNEAVVLLMEGVSVKQIERAATEFGMPMGPFTLYDVIGLDTAILAGKVLYQAFPSRTEVGPLLPAMLKAGRLGQKNGKGFFRYTGKSDKGEPDSEFDALLQQYAAPAKKLSTPFLIQRLFYPMLLEAVRALEEGICRDPRDVDLALILGLGFPPFRGGLFFWADTVGAAQICQDLAPLQSLGPRFHIPQRLASLATSGGKFYGTP